VCGVVNLEPGEGSSPAVSVSGGRLTQREQTTPGNYSKPVTEDDDAGEADGNGAPSSRSRLLTVWRKIH
jgi:hypothetical protein